MARATIQQVLNIVEGIQREVKSLSVTIKGDQERRVVGLVTEIELLKQRNRFEERLGNIAVGVGSALLVWLLTNGCQHLSPTPIPPSDECPTPPPIGASTRTEPPTPEPTRTPIATRTEMPTATGTPEPIYTPTAMPAIVEVTSTPTPPSIEVTPLGGEPAPAAGEKQEDLADASYTPRGVQNVRPCAVAGPECPILYRLKAGQPVPVYARVTVYPQGDVWLCLDVSYSPEGDLLGSQCGKMVAYKIGSAIFGELILSEEK